METLRLGSTEFEISRIGFGAWPMGGGGWIGGWGAQDDGESRRALFRALDHGVNWVDTAPIYGLGYSEELLGTILGELAQPPYVFTKCGIQWDSDGNEWVDVRPSSIRRGLEESLRRLRMDAVDLCMIHWPPEGPRDNGHLESAWETMVTLKREGKARQIGLSNCEVHHMRVLDGAKPACLQYPYSLVNRTLEGELLDYCGNEEIGVTVWGTMYHGILTGGWTRERFARLPEDDWRRHDDKFREPILSRSLDIGEALRNVAIELDDHPGRLAISWALRDRRVTGAIVGLRSPAQVDELVEAVAAPLAPDVEGRLNAFAPRVPLKARTF